MTSTCAVVRGSAANATTPRPASVSTPETDIAAVVPTAGPGGVQRWSIEARAARTLLVELPPSASLAVGTGRWTPSHPADLATSSDGGRTWTSLGSADALTGGEVDLPPTATHLLVTWPTEVATTVPLQLAVGVSEIGVLGPCVAVTGPGGSDRACAPVETAWTGSIGDRVWLDEDLDGRQGVAERGLVDVEIVLRDGDGEIVSRTRSGDGGSFVFEGLAPGRYVLAVVAPEGLVPTFVGVGDGALDSDVDRQTGEVALDLEPGAMLDAVDIGLVDASAPGAVPTPSDEAAPSPDEVASDPSSVGGGP